MQARIKNLQAEFENTTKIRAQYCANFKAILTEFITANNLDKIVIRHDIKRTERGEIRIIDDPERGYHNDKKIPSYIVFHPFKKDNTTLSDAHRIDKFEAATTEEYFSKILEIYKPE